MSAIAQTILHFTNAFDQTIDHLPNSLKKLSFGSQFNQPVTNLPDSLGMYFV